MPYHSTELLPSRSFPLPAARVSKPSPRPAIVRSPGSRHSGPPHAFAPARTGIGILDCPGFQASLLHLAQQSDTLSGWAFRLGCTLVGLCIPSESTSIPLGLAISVLGSRRRGAFRHSLLPPWWCFRLFSMFAAEHREHLLQLGPCGWTGEAVAIEGPSSVQSGAFGIGALICASHLAWPLLVLRSRPDCCRAPRQPKPPGALQGRHRARPVLAVLFHFRRLLVELGALGDVSLLHLLLICSPCVYFLFVYIHTYIYVCMYVCMYVCIPAGPSA